MTHPETFTPSKVAHPENSEPSRLAPVPFSSIPLESHFEAVGLIWRKTREDRAVLFGQDFSCRIAADEPCIVL